MPSSPPLICTVRGCGRPLARHDRAWVCPAAHAFDVARAGYVNLLQPQDRKSLAAGDAPAVVAARAALSAAGVGRGVIDTVRHALDALDLPAEAVVVDVGAGTGDALGTAAARWAATSVGIDLSSAAAGHAARAYPAVTWVVANADRGLPLADHSVDVLLSLHARRHPLESARVLKAGGVLIVAVPAADDVIELRARVQGAGVERDRTASLVAEHAALFALRERATVREQRPLGRDLLLALLSSTYRGARASAAARLEGLDHLVVTLASELCLFAPLPAAAAVCSPPPLPLPAPALALTEPPTPREPPRRERPASSEPPAPSPEVAPRAGTAGPDPGRARSRSSHRPRAPRRPMTSRRPPRR